MHWVFFGAEGLRAGWGVLLFVLLFIGFSFLAVQVVKHFLPPGHLRAVLPLKLAFISEGTQLVPLLLATAIMALIERRPLLAYGYQGPARAVRFISGLIWGFVALSVLVFILWKAGLLAFDGVQLHGPAIWKYAVGWGVLFLVVGVFEESTLRGYLQFTLTRGIGFWWGALLLSAYLGFPTAPTPARRR